MIRDIGTVLIIIAISSTALGDRPLHRLFSVESNAFGCDSKRPSRPASILRGSQPSSDKDYKYLSDNMNVGTVVSFRTDASVADEEKKWKTISDAKVKTCLDGGGDALACEKERIEFINIPMLVRKYPSPETMSKIERVIERIKKAEEMKAHPERFPGEEPPIKLPVFAHCIQGKDRTGFFTFLYRIWTKAHGLKNHPTKRYMVANARQEAYSCDFRKSYFGIKTTGLKKYIDQNYGHEEKWEEKVYSYPNLPNNEAFAATVDDHADRVKAAEDEEDEAEERRAQEDERANLSR